MLYALDSRVYRLSQKKRMDKFSLFSVIVILSFIHVTIVSCFKPGDYCAKVYVDKCVTYQHNAHIGCLNISRQMGVPDPLNKNERVLLTKYFNDIRNQIASTKNYANMKELTWNEEYEYLAGKAIEKLNIMESGCYWTENSKIFPTDLAISKTAINLNGSWVITVTNGVSFESSAFPPLMTEIEFGKINKINYLLDEEKRAILDQQTLFSTVHDPSSSFIGCSWAQTHNSTFDFKQIRCIINARMAYNESYYSVGIPCTKCELKSKCSKDFKFLCSSSDKFGIRFSLVSFMVFFGFAKLLQ